MGSQVVTNNTGNQMFIRTENTKMFVGNNRYEKAGWNNATYDPIVIPQGTVVGRVSASGLIKAFSAAANDGSQYPIGIVYESVTIEEGTTEEVYFCVAGDVVADKVVLPGGTTLDSTVANAGGRRVRDLIGAESVGIKLVTQNFDNTRIDNE